MKGGFGPRDVDVRALMRVSFHKPSSNLTKNRHPPKSIRSTVWLWVPVSRSMQPAARSGVGLGNPSSRSTAMVPILPALFAATMTLAVADNVPSLNNQPSCKAQADGIIGLKQDVEVCLKSEASIRAQLEQQWSQFAAADRASC